MKELIFSKVAEIILQLKKQTSQIFLKWFYSRSALSSCFKRFLMYARKKNFSFHALETINWYFMN